MRYPIMFAYLSAFICVAIDALYTFGLSHGITLIAILWLLLPGRKLPE